ncbi:hypothetical protein GOL31_32450 [Sinorhizobium medicae]|nr:hypothetical protein [Sinorhizobium medicae]MDX1091628.1 hypothetical protein [Sinorhizobium medicae]MDX1116359.1 hypothetical protein [Sinorhizobium medicae]
MNVHSRRPDRSPEAIEKRRKAAEQARAANIRQGYVHYPALEEARGSRRRRRRVPKPSDIYSLASQEQTPVRLTNERRYVLEQCVRNVLRSRQVSGGKAGSEAIKAVRRLSECALDY